MNASRFHAIYRELIDDNPLAVRAVLKVLEVAFTSAVPTLAVTLEDRPRLQVNLAFVRANCRTDEEVKALICHEFLHVLLRHTERFTRLTPADHLALDAVINAIIHRRLGPAYSGFMRRYYAKEKGARQLLRPPDLGPAGFVSRLRGRVKSLRGRHRRLRELWQALYAGTLVADDIRDLAQDLSATDQRGFERLLGGHDTLPDGDANDLFAAGGASDAAEELERAIDTSLKSMSGGDIFRNGRGLGDVVERTHFQAADAGVERWRREAYAVLRRHLLPDPRATGRELQTSSFTLPVLSPGDRRAALRALWSPFLPDARWATEKPARIGSAHVYLDVSGSMYSEMPIIVSLLGRLSSCIRRPFWAFSTAVAPARIERGRLVTDTTGGTSMACVLEHVARTKPPAAVVVTDGYIEALTKPQVAAAAGTRLHVIVTRGGCTAQLQRAGLPFTQLARLPQ